MQCGSTRVKLEKADEPFVGRTCETHNCVTGLLCMLSRAAAVVISVAEKGSRSEAREAFS